MLEADQWLCILNTVHGMIVGRTERIASSTLLTLLDVRFWG
jgi:hypothetical protein